jgi:hypothetical protein
MRNPLLFKSVLVAVVAGCFISNGWTTIVLLVERFLLLWLQATPMCADWLDQGSITTAAVAAATGRVMQFNEWYCRGGGLNSSKSPTSVRNVIKAAGIECGKRETELSGPQRMTTCTAT